MADAQFTALLLQGLNFESVPGTRFAYSNLSFALLGRVIERAGGVPYRDLVTARFTVGGTSHDVTVRQGLADPARLTCRAPRDATAYTFETVSVDRG